MESSRATAPRRLQDFAGRWAIDRRIEDAQSGEILEGCGTVEFRAAPDGGLIYDETLWLRFPGRPAVHGTRRYLWRAAGAEIAVFFEDGRPFHRIALGGTAACDSHDCAPDLYRGDYDFSSWPDWSVRWRAAGPRKDYVSTTVFRRTASAG